MHQLVVKPGFSEALKGDPLTVQANLLGPDFWTASITYNMAMFPEQTAEMKTREGLPNSFEFEFKNLQGDLRYKVQAGPLESVEYLVQVKPPAELTEIQLTYYYPEFMARGHEPQPTGQGAAMAPIGSTVEVTTRWSRPMKEVNIAVNGEAPIPCRQTDPYWRGAFRIESAGSYILSGSSVDGVPLRGNLEFPLQVLVDLPPTVEWIFPKEDIDFSEKKPKGKIPLRFRIEDDVGIQSVFLYSGSPGAVTQTHQIAQLDGKSKALESTFLFDWRPWMNRPVCRLYLEALDNHPQIPGRKRNETRRLYFQPPGSFEEIDSTTPEEEVIEDPYELTAIRLFFLLRKQMSQNSFVAENESKSPDLGDWKKTQRRTMQLAAQTAFSAWNSAQDLKRGPGAPAGVPAGATPAKEASPKVALPERPPDLPIRLEMVTQRLGGVEISIDDLLAAPPATGEAVVHRQARQYDAADKSYLRRSWEEGERAAREIAKAYKDLTGREPPISAERVENTIAEETRKAEGEEAEQQAKAEQAAKDQLRLGGDQESEDGASAAGVTGDSNDKEKDKQEKRQGESAASAPTSKYAPSEYTLDPDTVTLTTPQVQLMQNALSGTLAEDKAREFLQRPVPPEYKEAVAEYNRILLGE
ncbi:MAG: hypothetical protein HUU16_01070 [Candidatus Omnitrophica bacterium]|nr:hypothetical protein [Candidatus Omnitrophota bacterium]